MNCGYFCVFWRIFFGYTGIPLTPLADPERYSNKNVSKEWKEKLCIFKQTRPPNQTGQISTIIGMEFFYSQNADISLEKGPNSKREAMRCGLYSQATQASAQDMSAHRLWDSN